MKLSYIDSKIFGKVCYGFHRNNDGIVETIPDKAKVVEMIFLLYLNGNSLEDIQHYLFETKRAELSGGETQKLMLARALYKKAPFIILDEPTAALDPIAEADIYSKYNEMTKGCTSVYISHRLASTRFCDRILLIGNHKIAEEGTHEELLKLSGEYARLFEIQSKYYREGDVCEKGQETAEMA